MVNLDEIIRDLHASSTDDPDRQFNAAIALGRIRDVAVRARVVSELVSALASRHQALTRAHAAEALGELGDAQAIPALIGSLNDPYRLVRSYAARALGKMRDPEIARSIDPLVHQLKADDFFGARAEAAEALGNIAKLCEEHHYCDAELLKTAKAAVELDDLAKLKQIDDRFQRMINEMNNSIVRLSQRSHDLSEDEKRVVDHAANEIRVRSSKLV
jgi:hypothetical protein